MTIDTPIGKLTLHASNGALTHVCFEGEEMPSSGKAKFPSKLEGWRRGFPEMTGCVEHYYLNKDELPHTQPRYSLGTPLAKRGILESVLEIAATQLTEYFAGTRKTFDIPIDPPGTPFQKKIWAEMTANVKFGETTTYGELATLTGNPKASRAVGMANGRNPIPIIIPCHRVIGKGGKLTGFRWGLDVKVKLLEHEREK